MNDRTWFIVRRSGGQICWLQSRFTSRPSKDERSIGIELIWLKNECKHCIYFLSPNLSVTPNNKVSNKHIHKKALIEIKPQKNTQGPNKAEPRHEESNH